MKIGSIYYDGAPGTPSYKCRSYFCEAPGVDSEIIVDKLAKPRFCPLPITITWNER